MGQQRADAATAGPSALAEFPASSDATTCHVIVPSAVYGPMGASNAPPEAVILLRVSAPDGVSTNTSSTDARWSPGSTTLARADVVACRGPMHPKTVARLYTNGGRVSGPTCAVVGGTVVGGAVVAAGGFCSRGAAAFVSEAKD